MAQIRPFRAIRFAPERVDLAVTLAPPVADDALAQALYRRDPRNAARIAHALPEADDAEGARERRAAFFLADWLRAGVLVRDDEPALYLLRQTFPREEGEPLVRQGFYAWLDVEEDALLHAPDGVGAPWGDVEAVAARRARGADVEPVRVLHPDPEDRVARAFEVELEREADLRFSFGGASHELWIIDDETTTARVAQLVAEQPLSVVGGQRAFLAARAHAQEEACGRFALAFLRAMREGEGPEREADLAAPGALDDEGDPLLVREPPLATLDPQLPAGLVIASLARSS